jgi:hypothetical protein
MLTVYRRIVLNDVEAIAIVQALHKQRVMFQKPRHYWVKPIYIVSKDKKFDLQNSLGTYVKPKMV